MVRIMIAPNRYVQGPLVLAEAAKYVAHLGSKVVFVADPLAWSIVKKQISASLSENSMSFRFEPFSGLCTQAVSAHLSEKARAFGPDMIVEGIKKELGIAPGETTPDGRFSLELNNCQAICSPFQGKVRALRGNWQEEEARSRTSKPEQWQ